MIWDLNSLARLAYMYGYVAVVITFSLGANTATGPDVAFSLYNAPVLFCGTILLAFAFLALSEFWHKRATRQAEARQAFIDRLSQLEIRLGIPKGSMQDAKPAAPPNGCLETLKRVFALSLFFVPFAVPLILVGTGKFDIWVVVFVLAGVYVAIWNVAARHAWQNADKDHQAMDQSIARLQAALAPERSDGAV